MLTADDLLAPPGLAEGDKDGIAAAVARLMERLRAETFSARDGGKVLVDRATGERQPALFIAAYHATAHAYRAGPFVFYYDVFKNVCMLASWKKGADALGYALERIAREKPKLFEYRSPSTILVDDISRSSGRPKKRRRYIETSEATEAYWMELGISTVSSTVRLYAEEAQRAPVMETIAERMLDLNMLYVYTSAPLGWKCRHTPMSIVQRLKRVARGTEHVFFFELLREHGNAVPASEAGAILQVLFTSVRRTGEYFHVPLYPLGWSTEESLYVNARAGVRLLLVRHAAASSSTADDVTESARAALAAWTDAIEVAFATPASARWLTHCIELYCDTIEQAPLARARRRAIARLALRHGLPEDVVGTLNADMGLPPMDYALVERARATAINAAARFEKYGEPSTPTSP